MIYLHHVPRHDAADQLTELLRSRTEKEVRCTPGAPPRDGEEAKTRKQLICRNFVMPEEGLEPPTRGL